MVLHCVGCRARGADLGGSVPPAGSRSASTLSLPPPPPPTHTHLHAAESSPPASSDRVQASDDHPGPVCQRRAGQRGPTVGTLSLVRPTYVGTLPLTAPSVAVLLGDRFAQDTARRHGHVNASDDGQPGSLPVNLFADHL